MQIYIPECVHVCMYLIHIYKHIHILLFISCFVYNFPSGFSFILFHRAPSSSSSPSSAAAPSPSYPLPLVRLLTICDVPPFTMPEPRKFSVFWPFIAARFFILLLARNSPSSSSSSSIGMTTIIMMMMIIIVIFITQYTIFLAWWRHISHIPSVMYGTGLRFVCFFGSVGCC